MIATAPESRIDGELARADAGGWSHLIRKVDHGAIERGHWYDPEQAQRAVNFFEKALVLTTGQWAGQPFRLMEWQDDMIRRLFGWRKADGTRRFRQLFLFTGKKNSKTTTAAGLILYLLRAEPDPDRPERTEQGAEIYAASTSREQGSILFREASKMVDRSPVLSRDLDVWKHTKTIAYPRTHSFFRVLPHKARTVEGLIAQAVVLDEIHAMESRELYDALRYAGSARRQPLHVELSTAGTGTETLIRDRYDYACKVRDGKIEADGFLPMIFDAGPDDDWTDPATWKKANPSLGVTISEDDLRRECQEAQDSPTLEAAFRRYRLNQFQVSVSTFLDYDKWIDCPPPLDPEQLRGKPCFAGLDLSSNIDMTAAVLVFPQSDGMIDVLPWFWLPEDGIEEREAKDGVPYQRWAQEGLLTLTPGDYIDLDFIRNRFLDDLSKRFQIREIAYDPAFASGLCTKLAENGLKVFEFYQRPTMFTPVLAKLDELVRAGRLRHGHNPILNWQASNLEVKTNAEGHMKPAKPASRARHKSIDGMVALLMALGNVAAGKSGAPQRPYYEDHPLIVLD